MDPVFLGLDQVLEIHTGLIEAYGGGPGIRDLGLLESALSTPRAGSGGQYFHVDSYEMAAAYLFHIVKNHPFVDGNKRSGALCCYVFLRLNGLELECTNEALVDLVLAVAEGSRDKAAVTAFLRRY